MNVEVIAVSTDTHFSHWMFKKTSPAVRNVKYPLAADASGAVAKAYGVYQEHNGLAMRARFIISPEGEVMAVEMLTPPLGRNVDELIRQLEGLQTLRKHKGKAVPAGWKKPGDALIDTNKDAIGIY
jgi:NADH-dependent peroxiredoxin subunit C